MKRVIVDYKKLTNNILTLLVEKYPDGYGDDDIITFKNANNDSIEAVEVKTDDTIYLVKISKHLASSMESFLDDDDDSQDNSSENIEVPDDNDENDLE
jgi:hypothetical protein